MSESHFALRVENLAKHYLVRQPNAQGYVTLRDAIPEALSKLGKRVLSPFAKAAQPRDEVFFALRGISFQVQSGDRIGIVGRNGAGKSTLLKIISRITQPSAGRVLINGRVASLLEVGTGFHPELTGRENIFLSGTMLGMTRHEISRKFDEIVAFSEVERFLDTPVKRYSSGMYVRLAFGVAAHLDAEILLVDEVLAVGDLQFQKKCLGKMHDVSLGGRTVVFVSHNLAVLSALCERGLLLRNGVLEMDGSVTRVIDKYISDQGSSLEGGLSESKDREGNGRGRFVSISISSRGREVQSISTGGGFIVEVQIELNERLVEPHIGILFGNHYLEQIARAHTWESCKEIPSLVPGRHVVRCRIDRFPLLSGTYQVHLWLGEKGECWDYVKNAAEISVEATDVYGTGRAPKSQTCLCYFEHAWEWST